MRADRRVVWWIDRAALFTGAHPPTPPMNKAGVNMAAAFGWRLAAAASRRLLQALHLEVEAVLDMPGKHLQRFGFVAAFDYIHQRHMIAQ